MVYSKVNLHDIINKSINLFKFKAKEKKIDLITKIDENLPINFVTDPKRLR